MAMGGNGKGSLRHLGTGADCVGLLGILQSGYFASSPSESVMDSM